MSEISARVYSEWSHVADVERGLGDRHLSVPVQEPELDPDLLQEEVSEAIEILLALAQEIPLGLEREHEAPVTCTGRAERAIPALVEALKLDPPPLPAGNLHRGQAPIVPRERERGLDRRPLVLGGEREEDVRAVLLFAVQQERRGVT